MASNWVLAGQVPDLLLHEMNSVEQLGAAHQDRIAEQHSVLGAAHRDDVRVADRLGGADLKRGNRVGDAGPVDVHQQAECVGPVDEFGDRRSAPHPPVLGGLGDRDDPRLGVVHLGAAEHPARQHLGVDETVVAGQAGQLGAGESHRSARLVDQHMGDVAAEDLLPGAGRGGQRDDVGRGAGEREQHLGAGTAERVAQRIGRPRGDGVGTVGRGEAVVGPL